MSGRDKVTPPRSDVFISYSRKDREFVRRLDEALQARGREAWVDWEGIRPAEEFMHAIFPAIEGTDTFIFVISPDSVTSEVCGRELAHAVAHNKRMIPIIARDVDAKAIPESLAKLNWVFARETDGFDAATETLISALDTDLGWVRAHTRLLTRAIEWEAKARSNSFVLRGEDLRAAEQWLAQAGSDKERQPTELQTEYIIASRKASSKRQRITLGAVTFGALVSVVLAILAWTQRGKAVQQEKIATQNAAEATRQKEAALGALSQSDFAQGTRLIADQRAAQALAYLARAVRANGNPAAATRIGSLLIDRLWPMPLESPHADAVKTFFSPTGAHAVVVLADGSAEIRDNATGKALSPRIQLEAGVDAVRFSPDGARVLLAGDSSKEGVVNEPIPMAIQLWDTKSVRAITEAAPFQGAATEESFVFSPDSRFLALTALEGKTLIWDAQTGRELRRIESDGRVQFSRDGERIAIRHSNTAKVVETRTGKPIGAIIRPPDSVDEVALSPDGLYIATAGNMADGEGFGGADRVWEVATGKPVTPPMEQQSWVQRFEFSPGGQWLLTLGRREARVWDARTGKPITEWLRNPGAEWLSAATFSPDGLRVATVAEGNGVCLWDVATGRMTLQRIEVPGLTTAQFSGDSQRLIVGGFDGVSQLGFDLASASARPLALPGRSLAPHGFTLVTFQRDRFLVWDIRSAKILLEVPLDGWEREGAGEPAGTLSADGRRLLVEIGDTARLWELPSGKELLKLVETGHFELSHDGSKILSTDKSVKVLETESGRLLQEIKPAEGDAIISSQLSPDGRLVAIAFRRGEEARSVQLWDAATGRAASPPLVQQGLLAPSFSPDGARLITFSTSENGVSLRLWQVPGAEPVGEPAEIRLDPAEEWPSPIFSPDGQHFVVFANSGMRLFETASGKLTESPPMRRGGFMNARFSADSKLFATAGNDAQVWNATTGLPLIDPVKPPEHTGYLHAEFSADARRVLVAGIGGPEGTWGTTAIVDATTGHPIADSRTDEFPRRAAHFSPDGCLVVEKTDPKRVWDVPPPGKGPAWLADLAEAISGCVLTPAGTLELIPDRAKRLAAIRKQVAELPADDRWAQVARWFLAEPRSRTVSPYSSVKVADYVERCVKENSFEQLKEALAASPADPLAHALLGSKLIELDESELHALVRADGETLFATQLAPQNAIVWQARAKVLTALKRPAEAADAAKMAAELSRQ